jgi:aspartate/methionine/tyrosine aminotransferase
VEFCLENNLVLLADEVYQVCCTFPADVLTGLSIILSAFACQENVYDPGSKFQSFKKVASEMGVVKTSSKTTSYDPVRKLQLASFHSVSKGFLGEYVGRLGAVSWMVAEPRPCVLVTNVVGVVVVVATRSLSGSHRMSTHSCTSLPASRCAPI